MNISGIRKCLKALCRRHKAELTSADDTAEKAGIAARILLADGRDVTVTIYEEFRDDNPSWWVSGPAGSWSAPDAPDAVLTAVGLVLGYPPGVS